MTSQCLRLAEPGHNLRILVLAMKKINAAGGSLELRNVGDSTKEVLKTVGLSSIFKIV